MSRKKKDTTTLIEDPFGIPTLEIAEAQASNEELEIDGDLVLDEEKDRQTLEGLAAAMKNETEALEASLTKVTAGETEDEARARLAAEIAEDQALAAEERSAEETDEEKAELAGALPSMDVEEIQSCLEALLFMADKPMSLTKLHELLGPDFPFSLFQEAVTALRERYQKVSFGIELVEVGGGLQLRTKPGRAALARKLAKVQTQRLSTGAMETLAIVAYRQPVMKEEIDKVRGVDSSHFIRGLLEKNLIKISGRSELPGRPMLYATTPEFLELFGLKDLSALPSLRELEQMVPASESKNPEDVDPRVREMRRLVGEMKTDTSTTLIYDPREDEKILKDIRERVSAIPTSTPYLDQQREAEKLAAQAAEFPAEPAPEAAVQPWQASPGPSPSPSS
jgi:segregation and condensation protein B